MCIYCGLLSVVKLRRVLVGLGFQIIWCVFFFFFQAEDGIRDIGVTGVQTCALPILGVVDRDAVHVREHGRDLRAGGRVAGATPESSDEGRPVGGSGYPLRVPSPHGRSEERRVGKECRSRWSPYH